MRCLVAAALLVGSSWGCGSPPTSHPIESTRSIFRGTASFQTLRRDPHIEALPVIAVLRGANTEVILRGHLSKSQSRRAIKLARHVYRDFNIRFAGSGGDAPNIPVDVCLFRTTQGYWKTMEAVYGHRDFAEYGFYMGKDRLVLVNWAKSKNNIRHELTHPLLLDDFPDVPAWMNEGMASLYTTISMRHGKAHFLDNHRLRPLKQAIRSRTLPTLEELASSTRDDVYGPDQATYYATGRYLLLYLAQRGTLEKFYREMRSRPPTAERQLELLHRYVDYRAFVRWARKR